MSVGRATEVFERERNWLRSQPEMTPWNTGCDRLNQQLDHWLLQYSQLLCEHPVTRQHDTYSVYLVRLWYCWCHHWKQAIEQTAGQRVNGKEVARHVRAGRGYCGSRYLGGDPMRDVVLAVAIAARENRATAQFQQEYSELLTKRAGTVHPRFASEVDEWWTDFVDFLAGYSKPPGKLAQFTGKCALKLWLRTVVWRFLRRRHLPDVPVDIEVPAGQTVVPDQVARQEQVGVFRDVILQALNGLDAKDRLILSLIFIDGLQVTQAAQIVSLSAGQVVRRRQKALAFLREQAEKLATQSQNHSSFQDWIQLCFEDAKEFAMALIESLEQSLQTKGNS